MISLRASSTNKLWEPLGAPKTLENLRKIKVFGLLGAGIAVAFSGVNLVDQFAMLIHHLGAVRR